MFTQQALENVIYGKMVIIDALSGCLQLLEIYSNLIVPFGNFYIIDQ